MRTPYFLIDKKKMVQNIKAMTKRAADARVNFRPHVKTHKTVEAAKLQVKGNFGGITVSTLAEAFFYSEAGFRDITYAYPITPDKFSDVQELGRRTDHFYILLDHPETLRQLEAFSIENDCRFSVFLKVDSGSSRAGVNPIEENSFLLAEAISQSRNIDFTGILSHAGHTYQCRSIEEVKEHALKEARLMESFATELERRNIPCPVISVGSTPGNVHGTCYEKINEIRPGNYVLFDKTQADIHSCTLDEVACFVMSRVIGHYPDRNRLLFDAGALALSKDQGAVHMNDRITYGHIVGHPDLNIVGLSQEHGIAEQEKVIDYSKYPIGSLLKIIPNHSCLSAALFPEYQVEENGVIVDVWKPVRGWG
ncbi:MAG: alanine racemase [Balneolales bacterium]